MKITIFGLTISSSWGNGHATPYRAIIKALHRQGHRVEFFEKDVPYYAKHRDFDRLEYCSLHLYSNWEDIRRVAMQAVSNSDAIICASFCPYGAQIIDDVLDLANPIKVFYDLDTPVTLGGLERGKLEYLRREQIPEFDLYLSFTGGPTIQELTSVWGAKMAAPLYGCVDPDVHSRVEVPAEYCCDFSYMGTYAPDRQGKVEALFLEPARRSTSKTFVLAGPLYPWDWPWPVNVRRFEHVSTSDHSAFYSSSRVTLNLTRTEMARWGYCPSGRFFEAAACGTPIVTDYFAGLETFFDCDRELLVVESTEEVISALGLPNPELFEIARLAQERTLDQHTGEQRAKKLLAAIEACRTTSQPQRARSEVA